LQARDGVPVESDHLYVVPPNVVLTIQNSRLHLSPRPDSATQYFRSINSSFRWRTIRERARSA